MADFIDEVEGFEWDAGNMDKNILKHNVHRQECEEVFFNKPLSIREDTLHSKVESRYAAFGKTSNGRLLFVVFIIRNKKIRIISARDMSKKERKTYEEEIKRNPGL
ncbi:MAG: BrnT family toxin [Nitrospirae bacterium]|nr:BrnT family toxin [Nitrospirota bacterium]